MKPVVANTLVSLAVAVIMISGWAWSREYARRLEYEIQATRYRDALKLSESAVVIAVAAKSDNATVVYWSKQAEAMFGWTEDEMVGSPIDRMIVADMRGLHQRKFSAFVERGEMRAGAEAHIIRCDALHKDGTVIPLVLVVRMIGFSESEGSPVLATVMHPADKVNLINLYIKQGD